MLRKVLFFLLILFSSSSFGQFEHSGEPYKGLQAARDGQGKFWILNKHDIALTPIDSIPLNVTQIREKIEASSVNPVEKQLINRMMQAIEGEQNQKMRLWNMSRGSLLLQPILMEACYDALLKTHGKRKLKKMIRRKK